MVHNGHTLISGDPAELRKFADTLDKMNGTIAQIYTDKAGQSPEFWREVMSVETWFTAEEAMQAGLADEVIVGSEKVPENSFDLSIYSYAGREHAPAPISNTLESQPQPLDEVDWAAVSNLFGKVFA